MTRQNNLPSSNLSWQGRNGSCLFQASEKAPKKGALGAATRANCGIGPFREFYVGLLDQGMKPEMARLTLARKIAAIALTLWKKEARFDAQQLKTQAA